MRDKIRDPVPSLRFGAHPAGPAAVATHHDKTVLIAIEVLSRLARRGTVRSLHPNRADDQKCPRAFQGIYIHPHQSFQGCRGTVKIMSSGLMILQCFVVERLVIT